MDALMISQVGLTMTIPAMAVAPSPSARIIMVELSIRPSVEKEIVTGTSSYNNILTRNAVIITFTDYSMRRQFGSL